MASGDYVRRTAITRLAVSSEQAERLEATIDEYRIGANIATDIGWRHRVSEKHELQSLAYDEIRNRTPLGSQHAILACFQAAQAIKGVDERDSQGRAYSKPEFTAPTVRYDANTMTLFDDDTVSLATTDDRVRCELVLPDDEEGYQYQYLESDEWELAESTLTARDNDYFLHLGFRKPKPDTERSPAEDRIVLGVDLGIENLAVTSTAHFEGGQELIHEHREFERIRGNLQQTGTESAHRTILQRGNREERHSRDVIHRVSNRLLAQAVAYGCTHIAFEDLTHIRDSMPSKRKFHQWMHAKLVQYVEYKAAEIGIEVEYVDPRNTSKRCCECGHTSDSNRTERAFFECEKCGTTANADYNAAKNIGLRLVRRELHDSRRTGDSQLALKSGTVKPNRGFVSYSEQEVEVESTDKHHLNRSERASASCK
ncbi:RNA-guided endonuclease InsQ/TnpB family protein [Halosimplex carlsbadense]|uniref:RNA-guided endonuclease InsQ/TnpB family protein n=1 Tax=Halosimplex carlsbadense TaxID=171164 RepID=UPI0009E22221|nr:RNA-guided endonuclease TnpB family protein [Halosimplex carlsbadense]